MKLKSLTDVARYAYGLSWESWDLYFRNYAACSFDQEPMRVSRLRAIPHKGVCVKNNKVILPRDDFGFSEMDKFLVDNFSSSDYQAIINATTNTALTMLQSETENIFNTKELRASAIADLGNLIRQLPHLMSTLDDLFSNPAIEKESPGGIKIDLIHNRLRGVMPAFSKDDPESTLQILDSLKNSLKKIDTQKETNLEKGTRYLYEELLKIAVASAKLPLVKHIPVKDETFKPYSGRVAEKKPRSPQLFSMILTSRILKLLGFIPDYSYRRVCDYIKDTHVNLSEIETARDKVNHIIQHAKESYEKNHSITLRKSIDYFSINLEEVSRMRNDHPLNLKKLSLYERTLAWETVAFAQKLLDDEGDEAYWNFYSAIYST